MSRASIFSATFISKTCAHPKILLEETIGIRQRVALAMGETVHGLTTLEAGRKAIEAIKQLCRDIGVTEDKIPEMARLAFETDYNRWNPRYTTCEDFIAFFEKAYEEPNKGLTSAENI